MRVFRKCMDGLHFQCDAQEITENGIDNCQCACHSIKPDQSPEDADAEAAESEIGALHGKAYALHIRAAEAHELQTWTQEQLLAALDATELASMATSLTKETSNEHGAAHSVTPSTWNQMALRDARNGNHGSAARSHRLAAQAHEEAAKIPDVLKEELLPQGTALGQAFLAAVKEAETSGTQAVGMAFQGNLYEARHHSARSMRAAKIAERLGEVLLQSAEDAAAEADATIHAIPNGLLGPVVEAPQQPFPMELREGMLDWVEARMEEWKQKEWVSFLCEELGEGRITNLLAEYDQDADEADQEAEIESVQAELNRDQNLGQEDES